MAGSFVKQKAPSVLSREIQAATMGVVYGGQAYYLTFFFDLTPNPLSYEERGPLFLFSPLFAGEGPGVRV